MKYITIAIAFALLTGHIHAQEILNTQKKSQINAIDTAIKRLQRFKACLQGKEPCSKLDFAALTAIILYVYGVVNTTRYIFFPSTQANVKSPWSTLTTREKIGLGFTYANPTYWGSRTIQKLEKTAKRIQ